MENSIFVMAVLILGFPTVSTFLLQKWSNENPKWGAPVTIGVALLSAYIGCVIGTAITG